MHVCVYITVGKPLYVAILVWEGVHVCGQQRPAAGVTPQGPFILFSEAHCPGTCQEDQAGWLGSLRAHPSLPSQL